MQLPPKTAFPFVLVFYCYGGFPDGSDSKELACSAGDPGSIPGSGRSPGEGNGNPLQYSCLEYSMDRGAWEATSPWVHKELGTIEQLTLACYKFFPTCINNWLVYLFFVSPSLSKQGLFLPGTSLCCSMFCCLSRKVLKRL